MSLVLDRGMTDSIPSVTAKESVPLGLARRGIWGDLHGIPVERKAGVFQAASGHTVNLVDLPGTYSLRGRSPDEEITRDVVLGKLASESAPDLLLCVADATNLRVSLRLVIELKRVGRPILLVLNMIDIARRRGIDINLEKL